MLSESHHADMHKRHGHRHKRDSGFNVRQQYISRHDKFSYRPRGADDDFLSYPCLSEAEVSFRGPEEPSLKSFLRSLQAFLRPTTSNGLRFNRHTFTGKVDPPYESLRASLRTGSVCSESSVGSSLITNGCGACSTRPSNGGSQGVSKPIRRRDGPQGSRNEPGRGISNLFNRPIRVRLFEGESPTAIDCSIILKCSATETEPPGPDLDLEVVCQLDGLRDPFFGMEQPTYYFKEGRLGVFYIYQQGYMRDVEGQEHMDLRKKFTVKVRTDHLAHMSHLFGGTILPLSVKTMGNLR